MGLTGAILLGFFLAFGLWQHSETAQNGTVVVGTVLFSNADVSKDCWSQDGVALLTSRMLLAHLMPPPDKIKPDDDTFVTDIIEYFRLILEVVRSNTNGRIKHLLLMAVADAMGGYMKHLVLPVSKYSYYAGHIQYTSIIRLYQLYDELKSFLRTNGDGWAKAWHGAGKHIQAKALSLQAPSPTSDPCRGIIYYTTSPEIQKYRTSENDPAARSTCHFDVPLPFFDSKCHPAAIAVPFRTFGLRNLEARVSAYILVKYYVSVSKCMAARHTNENDIRTFNTNIFAFITTKVMPHLGDEKFYAAFGGVLRVLQTVEDYSRSSGGNNMGNINILPGMLDREPEDNQDTDEEMDASAQKTSEKHSRNNMILLAILSTITIWFCLGAAFVCCRIKANRQRGPRPETEEDIACTEDNACMEANCPAMKNVDNERTSSTTEMETMETRMLYSVQRMETKTSQSSKKSYRSSQTPSRKSMYSEDDSQSAVMPTRSGSRTFSHTTSLPLLPESPTSKPPVSGGTAKGSTTSSETPQKPPQIQVHSVQYYPPSFACHTSMTGKVRMDSSNEDCTSHPNTKRPFVFGYDFQTSSEGTTPRDRTTDGETEMANLSK